MVKITELPDAGAIDGSEAVPIVKAGVMKKTTMADLTAAQVAAIETAGAAQTDAVNAAGATQTGNVNAAGATQTGNVNTAGATQLDAVNLAATTALATIIAQVALAVAASGSAVASTLVPLEEANYLLAKTEQNTINTTLPTWVQTENSNFWGDSTGGGVGTLTFPVNYSMAGQLAAIMGGGFTVVNNSVGGTTSAQMLASFTAASSTVKGQHQFVTTGLNDLDTAVGNRRDWASAGYTKGNITSFKALITGGKQLCIVLAMRPDYSAPGQKGGADFTYHYRDMIATFGADAINISRHSRFWVDRNGPDLWHARRYHGIGFSKQGQSTLVGVNNAPYLTNAGAFADASQPIDRIGWNSTNLVWQRKTAAAGVAGWNNIDTKHRSRWGYQDGRDCIRSWGLAMTGQGAPYAPPQQLRCAFDVAAGTLIGTIAIRTSASAFGAADRAEIVAGNDDFVFTATPQGGVYRSTMGAMKRQIYTLVIKYTGANGYSSLAIVDVYVGRASTQTLPQKLLIPSPVSLYGMEGHGASNAGKTFSFAMWLNCSNLASGPYVCSFGSGAAGSSAKLIVRFVWNAASSTGTLEVLIYDDGNTMIGRFASKTAQFGGQGIPQNTWGWLTFSVDLAAATVIGYWNDTALTYTGTTSIATFVNAAIPFGNMSPGPFLCSRAPYGGDLSGLGGFLGGCGYLAMWTDYIDWSNAATRHQLFNADGTAAITNTTGTIDAHPAWLVAVQGEPIDMLWGGFNAAQLVQLNPAALETMTIV